MRYGLAVDSSVQCTSNLWKRRGWGRWIKVKVPRCRLVGERNVEVSLASNPPSQFSPSVNGFSLLNTADENEIQFPSNPPRFEENYGKANVLVVVVEEQSLDLDDQSCFATPTIVPVNPMEKNFPTWELSSSVCGVSSAPVQGCISRPKLSSHLDSA
ncbi:hypothetical protein M413DRAFT_388503 [Hebeloma cylindrosporum]|uniref:Uncharacterized protein n=1 Tax=Hebeloma cylindrosporum TaxID=76867 RepID=A0A0C3C4I7_HEBCY|nr:hypothetical protein M413DRAFT_388503 [Hebeloma cylindrosporum h7]